MVEIRKLRHRTVGQAMMVTEAALETIGVSRPAALLILGHMRSGSTLLLHLLLTNPEVSAVGERGAVYASSGDLARLALVTRKSRRALFTRLRYVADQVNHNNLVPDRALLGDARVKVVFLLRCPEDSLASIFELYRDHYEHPWSTGRVVDYYVERLGGLMKLAGGLAGPTRAALISYENLTQLPEATLEALRRFLGLTQGFSQTYASHSFTGKSGDPGPTITSGRIVQQRRSAQSEFSAFELQRAMEAYRRCCAALGRFALLPHAAPGVGL